MWQNCPNSLEILLLGTLLKLMFVLDTFWTKISTSGQSGFERNWADCWTKGVQGPLSWNCSEFTNQITELHVSIIVSANENAQNISKNVRGKNLNWYSVYPVNHTQCIDTKSLSMFLISIDAKYVPLDGSTNWF